MNRTLFTSVIAVALLVAPLAMAQEAPMWSVLSVQTQLGTQGTYEAELAKIWTAFKKAGVDRQIFVSTSTTEPGIYTFAVPVQSWADWGEAIAKVQQAYASIPDVMQKIQGTIQWNEQVMWASRPDLSYVPEQPRLADGEVGFTRIITIYPHPDKTAAVEAQIKKATALRKKHGLGTGTACFELAMGGRGPAYAILMDAKDEADSVATGANEQQKMGAEWQAYLQQTGPMIHHIEYQSGVGRPDLLYTP